LPKIDGKIGTRVACECGGWSLGRRLTHARSISGEGAPLHLQLRPQIQEHGQLAVSDLQRPYPAPTPPHRCHDHPPPQRLVRPRHHSLLAERAHEPWSLSRCINHCITISQSLLLLPSAYQPTPPTRTRYQPAALLIFSRKHGRQRDSETPITATQLALAQGSNCKSSLRTTSLAHNHHSAWLARPGIAT
jgi:hypothetical protein